LGLAHQEDQQCAEQQKRHRIDQNGAPGETAALDVDVWLVLQRNAVVFQHLADGIVFLQLEFELLLTARQLVGYGATVHIDVSQASLLHIGYELGDGDILLAGAALAHQGVHDGHHAHQDDHPDEAISQQATVHRRLSPTYTSLADRLAVGHLSNSLYQNRRPAPNGGRCAAVHVQFCDNASQNGKNGWVRLPSGKLQAGMRRCI
jgi:hypothetical protein